MLRRVAIAHEAWSMKYGDNVAYVAADERPHDGQTTDLAIWQADRSAPPEIDDLLNSQVQRLIGQLD